MNSEPSAHLPLAGVRPPPETFSHMLMRWVTRAMVVGVAASCVAHLLFLAVASAVTFSGPAQAGNSATGAVGVQMAVMSAERFGALEEAAIDTAMPSIADTPPSMLPGIDLKDAPGGGGLPDSGELGVVGNGLGGAGTGDGIGVGDGTGGTGGGGAKFFDVEARGQRFVWVCDISGSMSERLKLSQLKVELERSLDSLIDTAQFMVYFFESDVVPLKGKQGWRDATGRNKSEAFAQIKDLVARGGTNPIPAFTLAFTLKPRPDAIYFMTDGLFDVEVVEKIAIMNKTGKKVPVHCLALGDRSSEPLMRKIATDSGGSYTYVQIGGGK